MDFTMRNAMRQGRNPTGCYRTRENVASVGRSISWRVNSISTVSRAMRQDRNPTGCYRTRENVASVGRSISWRENSCLTARMALLLVSVFYGMPVFAQPLAAIPQSSAGQESLTATDNSSGELLRGGAITGQRPRVIVSTDIGGSDPDDFQSLIHLLVYSDILDLEGIISSPPKAGRVQHIHECLDAYADDFEHLRQRSGDYPPPATLRRLAKQGAIDPAPPRGWNEPTEGSRWIIQRSRIADDRPVWILVWGSITDVAQAVHDAPEIKQKIRVYSIGSWNTRNDRAAREYLFTEHPDLWWIESDTSFRGMYVGGNQAGEWGNSAFVDRHVRSHGALGDLFVEKKKDIKMGDTPSLLYLLRGDPDDPTAPHWGGAFTRVDQRPNYWTDRSEPALQEGNYPGARTVNRWREEYLVDWQKRMDRIQISND